MKFTIEKIEYRLAKKGEIYWHRELNKPCKSEGGHIDPVIVLIGYEPVKFVPKDGEDYCAPDSTVPKLYTGYVWENDNIDNFRLERGLVYPYTKEGKQQAIEHARKMLEV